MLKQRIMSISNKAAYSQLASWSLYQFITSVLLSSRAEAITSMHAVHMD